MFTETGDICSYVFCMNKEGRLTTDMICYPFFTKETQMIKRLFYLIQYMIHYDIEGYGLDQKSI